MSPPVLPLVWNQIMKPEWAWINVCLPHMRLWKQVKLMSIEMIWVILERDLICCALLLLLFASYSSRRMTALVYECMKYICRNLLKKKKNNPKWSRHKGQFKTPVMFYSSFQQWLTWRRADFTFSNRTPNKNPFLRHAYTPLRPRHKKQLVTRSTPTRRQMICPAGLCQRISNLTRW